MQASLFFLSVHLGYDSKIVESRVPIFRHRGVNGWVRLCPVTRSSSSKWRSSEILNPWDVGHAGWTHEHHDANNIEPATWFTVGSCFPADSGSGMTLKAVKRLVALDIQHDQTLDKRSTSVQPLVSGRPAERSVVSRHEASAGRTVRSGLRCLGPRSWPDRSTLASAMGEPVLQEARPAITGVGSFVGSAVVTLGRLSRVTATIRSFGDSGMIRRRGSLGRLGTKERGNQAFEAVGDGHGEPPRATRAKPWVWRPEVREANPKGPQPAADRFLSAGRPMTLRKGSSVSFGGLSPAVPGTGSRRDGSRPSIDPTESYLAKSAPARRLRPDFSEFSMSQDLLGSGEGE